MLSHGELIARIAIGAALGSVIGFERDRHKRPAGLRTHLLVALASATFMVVSSQFAYYQHFGASGIEVDASRIAASVVSAVGFLAGGAILRTGVSVQGLTTAAALWLVTAIGLCAGAGMYIEALFTTFIGIVALTFFRRFEDKDNLGVRRRVTITLGPSGSVASLVSTLSQLNVVVSDIEYEKRIGEPSETAVSFVIRHAEDLQASALVDALEHQAGVQHVHVKLRF